jgi:nucleotide-binding universal stress UspA family protein
MKIVLGIDDAPCSRAALEYLTRVPWSRDAEWRLVSVVQTPVMAHTVPAMSAQALQSTQAQRDEQREWLAGVDCELRDRGFSSRALVDIADPRTRLVEAARAEEADLLVVGSHGRTGLTRILLGSVASYVVTHADCSVLVVKGTPPPASGPMTILLGVDDSACSLEALTFVRGLAWPSGTWLHILSAVPPSRHPFLEAGPVSIRAAREEARIQRDLVSRYEDVAHQAGFVTDSSVPDGDPRVELQSAAARIGAHLMVVGSRGRTGLNRLLLGSVASHVVSHAPCSVLVVKRSKKRGMAPPPWIGAGNGEPPK